MKYYLPNKNLIFFNPGIPGIIFIHPAKQYVAAEQLLNVQESLVQKTTYPVIYIEDRRAKERRQQDVQDFLSSLGRGAPLINHCRQSNRSCRKIF